MALWGISKCISIFRSSYQHFKDKVVWDERFSLSAGFYIHCAPKIGRKVWKGIYKQMLKNAVNDFSYGF